MLARAHFGGPLRRPSALSLVLAVFVFVVILVRGELVGADQAVVRYATPAGLAQGPCIATSPCRLAAAVAAAQPGDEIVLEPGRYELSSTLEIDKAVDLHGMPGPLAEVRILYGAGGPAITVDDSGAVVSDLAIEAEGSASEALELDAGEVERVRAASLASGTPAVVLAGGLLRDSLVIAPEDGAVGVATDAPDKTLQISSQASGVTVEATGAKAVGVAVTSGGGGNATLTLTRSIVHGTSADVAAQGDTAASSNSALLLSHDDVVTQSPGSGATISDDGTDISAPPHFVAPANDDFRQAQGSPTIDAGGPLKDSTEEDLNGAPRTVGPATDIGAFEYGGPPEIQLDYSGTDGFDAEAVSALIVPGVDATSYHVDFGLSAAYGKQTPEQPAGTGGAPVFAPVTLSGLLPATVYHYRYVATSTAGTTVGQDGIFETRRPGLPLAYTGAVKTSTHAGGASIQLLGAANPDGAAATVHFEWGTSTKYGHTSTATAIGSGGADVPVGASLSGLAAGGTYHYRLAATNGSGTDRGADETFKLPAAATARIVSRRAGVSHRSAAVLVSCAGSAGARCRGTLRIDYRRHTIGIARVDIRAGKTSAVRVSLKPPASLTRSHPVSVVIVLTLTGSRPARATKLVLRRS